MIKVWESLAHMISKPHSALKCQCHYVFLSFQTFLCCSSTSCPLPLYSICAHLLGPLKTHIYVMAARRSHLQLEFFQYSWGITTRKSLPFRNNLPEIQFPMRSQHFALADNDMITVSVLSCFLSGQPNSPQGYFLSHYSGLFLART